MTSLRHRLYVSTPLSILVRCIWITIEPKSTGSELKSRDVLVDFLCDPPSWFLGGLSAKYLQSRTQPVIKGASGTLSRIGYICANLQTHISFKLVHTYRTTQAYTQTRWGTRDKSLKRLKR